MLLVELLVAQPARGARSAGRGSGQHVVCQCQHTQSQQSTTASQRHWCPYLINMQECFGRRCWCCCSCSCCRCRWGACGRAGAGAGAGSGLRTRSHLAWHGSGGVCWTWRWGGAGGSWGSTTRLRWRRDGEGGSVNHNPAWRRVTLEAVQCPWRVSAGRVACHPLMLSASASTGTSGSTTGTCADGACALEAGQQVGCYSTMVRRCRRWLEVLVLLLLLQSAV